jgi:hypothetical protein
MSYNTQIEGLKKGTRYNVFFEEGWCPKKLKKTNCLTFTGTFNKEAERYDGRPVLKFTDCVRGKTKYGSQEIESDYTVYRVEEASSSATRRAKRSSKKMRKSTRRNRRH